MSPPSLALFDTHRWDGMVLVDELSGSHFRGRPCLARGLARLSSIPIVGMVGLTVRHGARRVQMLGNRSGTGRRSTGWGALPWPAVPGAWSSPAFAGRGSLRLSEPPSLHGSTRLALAKSCPRWPKSCLPGLVSGPVCAGLPLPESCLPRSVSLAKPCLPKTGSAQVMSASANLWPSRVSSGLALAKSSLPRAGSGGKTCLRWPGSGQVTSPSACLWGQRVSPLVWLRPSHVSLGLPLGNSCLRWPGCGQVMACLAWRWPGPGSPSLALGAKHVSAGLALGAKRVSAALALAKSCLPRLASGQNMSPLTWLWPSHGSSGLALARSWLPQLGSGQVMASPAWLWPGHGEKKAHPAHR